MSEPTWDVRPGFTPDEAGRFAFEAWGAMVEALTRALNYWEPPCKAEDCDKGSHVEQLLAWRRATRALTLARRVTYRERSGG